MHENLYWLRRRGSTIADLSDAHTRALFPGRSLVAETAGSSDLLLQTDKYTRDQFARVDGN